MNLPVPYATRIHKPVGSKLLIKGTPIAHAQSINFSLCAADELEDGPIAFFFDVRFPERVVWRNFKYGNSLGTADTSGHFLFQEEKPYEVKFTMTPTAFQISVTDEHSGRSFDYQPFRYPTTNEKMMYLHITGDTSIVSVD